MSLPGCALLLKCNHALLQGRCCIIHWLKFLGILQVPCSILFEDRAYMSTKSTQLGSRSLQGLHFAFSQGAGKINQKCEDGDNSYEGIAWDGLTQQHTLVRKMLCYVESMV